MSNRLDTMAGHILVLVAVIAVTLVGYYKADAKYQAATIETHNALCSFKNDLQRRHANGIQFVADIESGKREPIPGIPLAELHQSLDNQRRTLDSLSPLDCS